MNTATATSPVVFAPVLHPYRACELCDHGCTTTGTLLCRHPDARGTPVPPHRASGGHCGPEALRLSFPGLD